MTAPFGQRVRMNCATTREVYPDWTHNSYPLFVNGEIDISQRSQYSVEKSVSGQYDLVIEKVTAAEAGVYKCIDNAGIGSVLVTYVLTVTGNNEQESQCYI